MFSKLVVAVAAFVAGANAQHPFGCNKETDCQSCVEKQIVIDYPCYWCEIDNVCHAVGSLESPCTPASADDKCISLNKDSNCYMKSADNCTATKLLPAKPAFLRNVVPE